MRITISEFEASTSLTFECGDNPCDGAISEAGHEPNGYFWEGLVQFAWPDLAEALEFDSEAGMFAAYGSRQDLVALKTALDPLLGGTDRVADIISRAEAAGFQLDD